ncbi:MAG: hypothetical protein BWK80_56730 [Desulfobacteraceae bacterium IS3]|nr:MAG: hypothetical protein BWK80_56730 [Desulfobacteraceae bacterium IS3]
MKKRCLFDNSMFGTGILFLFSLFVFACAGQQVVSEPPPPVPSNLNSILIVSFKDMSKGFQDNTSVRCPLCGKIFTGGEVWKDAPNILTEQLVNLFKTRNDFKLIPFAHDQQARSGAAEHKEGFSERDMLIEAGRKFGADAVMGGYIYRFRDRAGSDYSVDSPASVAFGLHLLRVADGRVLWSAHFDETQHSLNENLFHFDTFLKREGKWITGREMAISALQDMLATLRKEK